MSSEPAGGAAGQASLLLGQIVHIAAGANKSSMRGKRVRLVCGTTSMYTGLDGLTALSAAICGATHAMGVTMCSAMRWGAS